MKTSFADALCYALFVLPVLLIPRSLAAVKLTHEYPEDGNFNLIELSCRSNDVFSTGVLEGADFFVSREPDSSSDGAAQIDGEVVPGKSGVRLVTITSATEGYFTCRHGGETSPPVPLAAQPAPTDYFDCDTNVGNPIRYHLLPYSEQNLYRVNCSVEPGRLRESYEVRWFALDEDVAKLLPDNDVDMNTFHLQLRLDEFRPLINKRKWLRCRVDIDHDTETERSYCGSRIRTAVEATITNGLPPQISVTVGDPLELNCTASGHELDISWSLGGKTYSLSDECRNGVCVHFERINDLTLTSHLTLTSIDTASPRETPVECIVRQELPEVFSAEVKRSASRIVITDGQISSSDPTTAPSVSTTPSVPTESPDSPNSDPESTDSTQDPGNSATDPPSPPLSEKQETLIIIIVPTTVVVILLVVFVAICLLCYMKYRSRRKRRMSVGGRLAEDGLGDRYTSRYSPDHLYDTINDYPGATVSYTEPLLTAPQAGPSLMPSTSSNSDSCDGPNVPRWIVKSPPKIFSFTVPHEFRVFTDPPLAQNGTPRYVTLRATSPLQANSDVPPRYILMGPHKNSTPLEPPHTPNGMTMSHYVPRTPRQIVVTSKSSPSAPVSQYTVNEVILQNQLNGLLTKVCSVANKTTLSYECRESICNKTEPVISELLDEDYIEPLENTTEMEPDQAGRVETTNEPVDSDPLECDRIGPLETTNDPITPDCASEDYAGPLETTSEPQCDNEDHLELQGTTGTNDDELCKPWETRL